MDMRRATREIRMQHWAGILHERQTSGQSIRAWCQTNGVVEKTYHYWKRKLRESAYGLYVEKHTNAGPPGPVFSEVKVLEATPNPALSEYIPSSQIRMTVSGIEIIAESGYPVAQLAVLIRELMRPC